MISEVDVRKFIAAHADGAHVLDVREPHEYEAGHVPGARLVPLSTVPYVAHQLPMGLPIYVICQSGDRSRVAAQHLAQIGHDVRAVIGGTSSWINAGRPVVRGLRANIA